MMTWLPDTMNALANLLTGIIIAYNARLLREVLKDIRGARQEAVERAEE